MKKSKKLLSVLLAFVMVLSAVAATFAASAADAYKPTYSEDVTEKDIADLIGDINTILNDQLLTGATIESIYKALPALKSIILLTGAADASNTTTFYKTANPERFADLPDDETIVDDVVDAETGAITTPGTFSTFFETHPIKCETQDDFKKELNAIIDMVVCANLVQVLYMVPMMGATDAPEVGHGIDMVCKALGIAQEDEFAEISGFNLMVTGGIGDNLKLAAYLKNIVNALFTPDLANSVINVIQKIVTDEGGALFYGGVSKVLTSLSSVLDALKSSLGSIIDVDAVKAQVEELKASFDALPTVGEGDAKMLDLEGTISSLIMSLTSNALAIVFVDKANTPTVNVPGAMVVMKFSYMQLDRVSEAESNADVVKIVYDYLYDNLIADKDNNALIKVAVEFGVIENALGVKLEPEVKAFILNALKMSNDELMEEAIVAAANAAGRELPKPEEPTTEEDTTEPTTEEDTTKPTTEEDTTETTTKADTVKDVNIPKTGKSAATVSFALISLAAAAGIVAVSRKKND